MSKSGIVNPDDDSKYRDVIKTLRQLQEVKAPEGFEADLMRRINSEKTDIPESFLKNILGNSRLIPAAALAVTAILLIFVLDHSGVTQENPLLTAPRERQDIKVAAKLDNITPESKISKNEEISTRQDISGIRKDNDKAIMEESEVRTERKLKQRRTSFEEHMARNAAGSDRFITADLSSDKIANYPVSKAGLNFRQVNLSNKQKIQLDQLKEKLQEMFKTRGKQ